MRDQVRTTDLPVSKLAPQSLNHLALTVFDAAPYSPDGTKRCTHWFRTFKVYINSIKPEDLNKLETPTRLIDRTVCDFIGGCSIYDPVKTLLEKLYIRPKNIVYARQVLAKNKQEPGQDVGHFVQKLKSLAYDCQFKAVSTVEHTNKAVRDALITRLQSNAIREELLTVRTAFENRKHELENAMVVTVDYNIPVFVGSSRRDRNLPWCDGIALRTDDSVRLASVLHAVSARHMSPTSSGISKSIFKPRHPVSLAVFNVRTLKQAEQQAALDLTLDSLGIDVCCVSETRIQDSSTILELTAPLKKLFSCNTLSVPSCDATRGKHEGWDTARLPKPRQGKSRGRGQVRTTDVSSPFAFVCAPLVIQRLLRRDVQRLVSSWVDGRKYPYFTGWLLIVAYVRFVWQRLCCHSDRPAAMTSVDSKSQSVVEGQPGPQLLPMIAKAVKLSQELPTVNTPAYIYYNDFPQYKAIAAGQSKKILSMYNVFTILYRFFQCPKCTRPFGCENQQFLVDGNGYGRRPWPKSDRTESLREFGCRCPQEPEYLNRMVEGRDKNSLPNELEGDKEYPHPYEAELDAFAHTISHWKPLNPEAHPLEPMGANYKFVDTLSALDAALAEISLHKEIAVDLEHHSHRSYLGITCLVQLSTRTTDYILDALALRDHLHKLNVIFTDPDVVKVFHGSDLDLMWLQRDFSIYVVNLFDTGLAARALQLGRFSLSFLLLRYANVRANKKYQLADWRIRPLPDELIEYARTDTHYLLHVSAVMCQELQDRGLLDVVLEGGRQLCLKRYTKPAFDPLGYLSLYRQAAGTSFNHRQLYALEQLYALRDSIARREDESVHYVLPNHMLKTIAEVLPRESSGLFACCNPIPPLVRKYVHDLHKIIVDARNRPISELPKSLRPQTAFAYSTNMKMFIAFPKRQGRTPGYFGQLIAGRCIRLTGPPPLHDHRNVFRQVLRLLSIGLTESSKTFSSEMTYTKDTVVQSAAPVPRQTPAEPIIKLEVDDEPNETGRPIVPSEQKGFMAGKPQVLTDPDSSTTADAPNFDSDEVVILRQEMVSGTGLTSLDVDTKHLSFFSVRVKQMGSDASPLATEVSFFDLSTLTISNDPLIYCINLIIITVNCKNLMLLAQFRSP
ncbi:exosome complex exonuclease RRP6, partial [Clonorchis sinensis]